MTDRRRPGLITLIAAINVIVGLLGGAALAASAYVDFHEFTHTPKSPPPEPAVNPEQGAPQNMGPPRLPTPTPITPPKEPVVLEPPPRPIEPGANPYGYFRARQHFLIRQVVTYELYVTILVPLGAILAALLVGSGIALFAMRPAARAVTIWFALLAPLVMGASVAYTLFGVVPNLRKWDGHRSYLYSAGLGEDPPPQMSVKLVYAVEGVSLLLGVAYPLLLLWAMQRPSIRAALTPAPSPVNEEMPPAPAIPPPEPVPAAGV
jgi:hypothetical protein